MLLAIDAGNTNVKFAIISDKGEIKFRWRIATDARRTADEYAVWLDQLLRMSGHERGDVTAVIIATVVPRALHNLTTLAQKYFGVDPLVAGRAPVEWGIALRVDEPQAVGADRAVIGGRRKDCYQFWHSHNDRSYRRRWRILRRNNRAGHQSVTRRIGRRHRKVAAYCHRGAG
jgi:pantothenate kinase type III